jgi:hypothetical protein
VPIWAIKLKAGGMGWGGHGERVNQNMNIIIKNRGRGQKASSNSMTVATLVISSGVSLRTANRHPPALKQGGDGGAWGAGGPAGDGCAAAVRGFIQDVPVLSFDILIINKLLYILIYLEIIAWEGSRCCSLLINCYVVWVSDGELARSGWGRLAWRHGKCWGI